MDGCPCPFGEHEGGVAVEYGAGSADGGEVGGGGGRFEPAPEPGSAGVLAKRFDGGGPLSGQPVVGAGDAS